MTLNEAIEVADFKIINALGETVDIIKLNGITSGVSEIPFNSSNLKQGIYIYSVQTGSSSYSGQFIKN